MCALVTGVQTCALPISRRALRRRGSEGDGGPRPAPAAHRGAHRLLGRRHRARHAPAAQHLRRDDRPGAGGIVAQGPPEEVLEHPAVIASYLGTDDTATNRAAAAAPPGARQSAVWGTGV